MPGQLAEFAANWDVNYPTISALSFVRKRNRSQPTVLYHLVTILFPNEPKSGRTCSLFHLSWGAMNFSCDRSGCSIRMRTTLPWAVNPCITEAPACRLVFATEGGKLPLLLHDLFTLSRELIFAYQAIVFESFKAAQFLHGIAGRVINLRARLRFDIN